MKKTLCLMMAVMVAVVLAACGNPAATETKTTSELEQESPGIVVFADSVLEARVREAMNKPDGDITIAEAEAVTELQLSTDYTPSEPEEGTIITDLRGLEYFTNLENLELHFHAVTDITPLAGLTKLHSLSLGGNPIADITPLSGLTNLGWLTLFNCQAQDYTPLANLTMLGGLLMDYSTISDVSMLSGLTQLWWLGLSNTQVSDVSPLAGLVNLTKLQLEGCPITDYSPLVNIYPNLEEVDFAIASSLRELGFAPIDNQPQVESYKSDEIIVQVHHAEWGELENRDDANAVKLCKNYGTENEIIIIYYPGNRSYLVTSNTQDFRYTYDTQNEHIDMEYSGGDVDAFMGVAYDEVDPYPVLTPIKDFSKVLTDTFGASADILYNLPRENVDASASSLAELGFVMDDNAHIANYGNDMMSIAINHAAWGEIPEGLELEVDAITIYWLTDSGNRLITGYYPDSQTYAFGIGRDAEILANYFYDQASGTFTFNTGDRQSVESAVNATLGETGSEDVLLAPVALYNDALESAFGMTADEIFALPMGANEADKSSLSGLGFSADESTASYLYESHSEQYYSVQIYNPEWGYWDEGGDVRFFTPFSDEYRVVVTYFNDENKFLVKADDNNGSGASYEFFVDTSEHIDGWCGNDELTVEEYFTIAINNSDITDIYLYPIDLMVKYTEKTFGMSVVDLYNLPFES